MIAEFNSVGDDEFVARFVHFANRVRSDGTVKQDAFMPPPDLELSVTRHGSGGATSLWARGVAVGATINRALIGRADITGGAIRVVRPLDVVAAPLPENPDHGHIIGWPPAADKPAQKVLAMSLAAVSVFVRYPGEPTLE